MILKPDPIKLRSLDQLDLPLAWKRVCRWSRSSMRDVPDRLPYELMRKMYKPHPEMYAEHVLDPAMIVFASKKSGTARPFMRLGPRDMLLYQALVDRLARPIERRLASVGVVCAYRQTQTRNDDMFFRTPRFADYASIVRGTAQDGVSSHVLKADISGYYMHIRPDTLAAKLAEIDADPDVVEDLSGLISAWNDAGLLGLPQGLQPSSPLANVYLASLDDLLDNRKYARFNDDFHVFCHCYSDAVRLRDDVEEHLYKLGLTLSAEKTKVMLASEVPDDLPSGRELVDSKVKSRWREIVEFAALVTADYEEPEEPEHDQIEIETVVAIYEQIATAIETGEFPPGTRTALSECFRRMRDQKTTEGLAQIPVLLSRCPDLMGTALEYVAACGSVAEGEVQKLFEYVCDPSRSFRDQEKIQISAASLKISSDGSGYLGERFALQAIKDDHPLVRARAVLAWGYHSDSAALSTADSYWARASGQFKAYAIASIQAKDEKARDQLFEKWLSSVNSRRPFAQVVESIRKERLKWSRI